MECVLKVGRAEALLMSLSDRRLGRITVQELRHDLREADEDRFRLMSALTLRRSSNGIIGVLFLLISGFVSALWTSRGPAPAIGLVSAATTEVVAPVVVARSGRQIEETVVETPVAKPPRQIRRLAHTSRGRFVHVATSRGQLVYGGMVERPRPPVARPLHPGEFGRLSPSARRTEAPAH
jgi:hypothetical protein